MDHPSVSSTAIHRAAKRRYHFLRFKLEPGDEKFINRLPEEQRVLLLAEGTYLAKATRLNIPVGTVRSRLHRARTAVARMRNEAHSEVRAEMQSELN
jgi:hypothetical protein